MDLIKKNLSHPIDSEEELLATQKVIDSLIDRDRNSQTTKFNPN